ncbi:MAG: hypothetical protein K8W52_21325 [Deltaproteobacteria bacterium]|nr:hypothetical protein [Deltaproteobacteria bacterium]
MADSSTLAHALRASDGDRTTVAARDAFLAQVPATDDDLAHRWKDAGRGGRAEIVAALARRSLVRASRVDIAHALPPGLAGALVESGYWTTREAMAVARTPYGGFAPATLASLAPWLDAAEVRLALAIVAERPLVDSMDDAVGLAAAVDRLITLEGIGAVEGALAPFSPAIRAVVAARAWPGWPDALHALAARLVVDGAHTVRHCSEAAATLFATLPILGAPIRSELIMRALDRLADEDFGLDCEHAALLGAAGEWQPGWRDATHHSLPYPRARMLAAIVPHLPDELRPDGYAQWLDIHRSARADVGGAPIPAALPAEIFDQVLRVASEDPSGTRRAETLVALAYQRRELVGEAVDAVRSLSGANGACARLAILPVVDVDLRERLATEAFDELVAVADSDDRRALSSASERWPRGPEHRRWSYLSSMRRERALLVEPLAWMAPATRAARALALLQRATHGRDTAILAGAAAAIAHLAADARGEWPARLIGRARDDLHPAALVEIAELLPERDRAALAERAWRTPRIAGREAIVGRALARAAPWLRPDARASVQLAALERWSTPPSEVAWHTLLDKLGGALVPDAIAWIRAHADHPFVRSALVPHLPAALRASTATEHLTWLARSRLSWQRSDELLELSAYATDPVPLLVAAIAEWRPRAARDVQWAIAWAIEPIAAAGELEHALTLRRELADPKAACIADLALARHEPDGPAREARLANALDHLAALTAGDRASDAWRAALRWLAPGPHRAAALAIAAALDEVPWAGFAFVAHQLGMRDELVAQLTPARAMALATGALSELGIGPEVWLRVLDDDQAFACWLHFCMRASATPRSRLMPEAFVAWIPVAQRAGGSPCLEGIASAVADVADWFP